MAADLWEYAARSFEPATQRWATPGDLASDLNPTTRRTPALDLIDQALVDLLHTPDGRLIVSMSPQEGKSQRVAGDFPAWALLHNPELRIVVASYGDSLARRNGRQIRDRILSHPELGLRVRGDVAAQGEWQLEGHAGGVYAAGIGTALTGRPADLMVIDDPIKDRAEADSPVYRQRVYDWWTAVASTRLAPGAPVVLVLTRWHEDDLAGRLRIADDGHLWRVINIPAQADHRPEEGQTDALGREPGEFMVSARGRTDVQWEAIKVRSGSRTWSALYQGRPAPAEGAMFPRSGWAWYSAPQAVERGDGSWWLPGEVEVCQSWDMAFKDTAGSDYVVGQVWARRGVQAFLIDQVRGHLSFVETCRALRTLSAKWPQSTAKYVEDKANGTAVMNALAQTVPGMIPVEPEGGKVARAAAVSPFVEAGNVLLPDPALAPWIGDLTDEAAAFPTGAHDDQVDALTQAVNRLLLSPMLAEQLVVTDEVFDEYVISPY